MPVYIDETKLENAATDVASLALFVNGAPTAGVSGVITTRLGTELTVLSKIVADSTSALATLISDTTDDLDALETAHQAAIDLIEADVADFLSGSATISQGKELRGLNAQSGTTYTPVLDDAGKNVRCTNSSPITITIPPNSSVAFPVNTVIYFSQGGTGQLSLVAGVGVTVNESSPLTGTLKGQWRAAIKVATNEWDIV